MKREVYDRDWNYLGLASFDAMVEAGWSFQVVRNRMNHLGKTETVYLLDEQCEPCDFCV